MEEIYLDLQQIFQDYFGLPNLVVQAKTSADDIERWDSLNHFELIGLIEDHFQIEFQLDDVMDFRNVGDMAVGIFKQLKRSDT